MLNTRCWLTLSLALLPAAIAQAAPAGLAPATRAKSVCTPTESWSFGAGIPLGLQEAIQKTLSSDATPAEGYAEAVTYRTAYVNPEAKHLAEYAQARALLQGKLTHLAYEKFSQIAATKPTSQSERTIHTAALECVIRLHHDLPTLPLPLEPEALAGLPKTTALTEYAVNWIKIRTHENASAASIEAALKHLAGTGPYESLARGLIAASRQDHAQTIQHLEAFLGAGGRAAKSPAVPKALRKHVNHARLMLARALFSTEKYELAASRYQQIDRSANDVTTMLSELSWAYLQANRLGDAVGAAGQLQAGNLRSTFAPEAPMVTAMALNELCQYPDSLRAIQKLNRDYRPSYEWLASWSKSKSELYPLAIAYLTKQLEPGTVPDRVATEWLRSSVFITLQDEINRLYAEQDAIAEFAEGFLAVQEKLKPELENLRDETDAEDVREFKILSARYNAMSQAYDSWKKTEARFARESETRQSKLVSQVNADLATRSGMMLRQLRDVAENTQMIKVEIYNGASHDLIWQNANPDFKKVAKELAAEARAQQKAPVSKVWDWGTVRTSSNKIEVWEDELGAFKANLADNCSNKNKFLALKKMEASSN